MSSHGRREDPQFFNIYELDWKRHADGPEVVADVEARLVTENGATGAATYMARVPAG